MRKLSIACIAICIGQTIFPSIGWAADEKNLSAVRGSPPCSEYIEALTQDKMLQQRIANKYYIGGWLDAYNMQTPNTFDITGDKSFNGIGLWLEKYCRDKPFNNLTQALLAMSKEIYPSRLQHAPVKNLN